VIRKIAHDARDLPGSAGLRAGESGEAALDERVEVERKNIRLNDLDVALLRILHAQLSSENAVELDGDEFARASREQLGESAFASADLEHGLVPQIAKRGDDLLGGVLVSKEVLAEFGLTQCDKFFSLAAR
jgi:hypothetical protein